jgi:hypothetical protein
MARRRDEFLRLCVCDRRVSGQIIDGDVLHSLCFDALQIAMKLRAKFEVRILYECLHTKLLCFIGAKTNGVRTFSMMPP